MNTRGERGAARLADRSQRSIKDTSGQSRPVQKQPLTSSRDQRLRGDAGNRTRIHGFAERCLPPDHPSSGRMDEPLRGPPRDERGADQGSVMAHGGQFPSLRGDDDGDCGPLPRGSPLSIRSSPRRPSRVPAGPRHHHIDRTGPLPVRRRCHLSSQFYCTLKTQGTIKL